MYKKLSQWSSTSNPTLHPETRDRRLEICNDVMRHDIAIVKVNFETTKYIRTVKDRKFSLEDKISYLGKQFLILFVVCILLAIDFLGGTLGLFTGMSLLSMVEFVFWMVKIFFKYLQGQHKQ